MVRETWCLFTGNLVLLAPVAIVWLLTMVFYGLLAFVFFTTCYTGFRAIISGLQNITDLRMADLMRWVVSSAVYLVGIVSAAVVFQFALGILHGAGWGRMFERAVKTGRTGPSDYFEGVFSFSGRMFGYAMLRGGIVGLPLVVFLMILTVLAVSNAKGGPIILFAVFCGFGSLLSMAAVGFFTWMWRPAIFIRDIGVAEGLHAGFRFTARRLGWLILLLMTWIVFSFTIGMVFGVVELPMRMMMARQGPATATAVLFAMDVGIRIINCLAVMLLSAFFILLYFKYYAEEWRAVEGLPAEAVPVAEPQLTSESAQPPGQPVEQPRE
jgi:hypothetical protein